MSLKDQAIIVTGGASVVAFLFSDAADAVNGSTVAADDGFLAFKV